MNESFMFIFIFTVLALGEKCARFVQFIHGSFTELVNRERLHEHARYATRTCTHTHYIYIYIYIYICIYYVFGPCSFIYSVNKTTTYGDDLTHLQP